MVSLGASDINSTANLEQTYDGAFIKVATAAVYFVAIILTDTRVAPARRSLALVPKRFVYPHFD